MLVMIAKVQIGDSNAEVKMTAEQAMTMASSRVPVHGDAEAVQS